MENQIVVFALGSEYFGADIAKVESIIKMQAITQLPQTPTYIKGVTNLRGRILSVINLREFLGLPASQQPEEGILLFVQAPAMEVIFWVDDVPGVEILPVRKDLSGDSLIHHLRPEFVQAVVERRNCPADQRHITVLNMETLLTDRRLIIHEDLA